MFIVFCEFMFLGREIKPCCWLCFCGLPWKETKTGKRDRCFGNLRPKSNDVLPRRLFSCPNSHRTKR